MSAFWSEEFSFTNTDIERIKKILGTDPHIEAIEDLIGLHLGLKKELTENNTKPKETKEHIEKIGKSADQLRNLLLNTSFNIEKEFGTKLAQISPDMDINDLALKLTFISAAAKNPTDFNLRGRPRNQDNTFLNGLAKIWKTIFNEYPKHEQFSRIAGHEYSGDFYELVRIINESAELGITNSSTKTFLLSL